MLQAVGENHWVDSMAQRLSRKDVTTHLGSTVWLAGSFRTLIDPHPDPNIPIFIVLIYFVYRNLPEKFGLQSELFFFFFRILVLSAIGNF